MNVHSVVANPHVDLNNARNLPRVDHCKVFGCSICAFARAHFPEDDPTIVSHWGSWSAHSSGPVTLDLLEDHPMAKISVRERLSGRSINIRKNIDGSWSAYLFPNGDHLLASPERADDPCAAVVRLARKLQELPQ